MTSAIKYLFLIVIIVSTKSYACSCAGVQDIETVITSHPLLVHATVDDVGPKQYMATLIILKVLKGELKKSKVVITDSMCYQSITTQELEFEREYIFSLPQLHKGAHQLPACSYTALERVGDALFTHELSADGTQSMKYYMRYQDFIEEYDMQ